MKQFIFIFCYCITALFATANPLECISNLGKFLDKAGITDFDTFESYKITRTFVYGNVPDLGNNVLYQKAFQKVYTTMSEVTVLCGDELTGKGLRGYNRYCGGIIRGSVDRDFFEELLKVFGGRGSLDAKGFNKVMEQLDSTGMWISQGVWKSDAGLIFKTGTQEGHRISHLFTHTIPDYKGAGVLHSVFSVERKDLLPLIDEAYQVPRNRWVQAFEQDGVTPIPNGYKIPLDKVVGTSNEQHIVIKFLDAAATEFQTGYPSL